MTLEEFTKAVERLAEAVAQPKNDFLRDSVIQRFEFSVELAWKTTKRVMGVSTAAPKDVVREMAQSGYISDVALWLNAIDMRNLSSHTYKEDLAEQVYAFACAFVPSLQALVRQLAKQ
jgi:nucleotidyltransferase substrate binding protein (TIGR01987 family)